MVTVAENMVHALRASGIDRVYVHTGRFVERVHRRPRKDGTSAGCTCGTRNRRRSPRRRMLPDRRARGRRGLLRAGNCTSSTASTTRPVAGAVLAIAAHIPTVRSAPATSGRRIRRALPRIEYLRRVSPTISDAATDGDRHAGAIESAASPCSSSPAMSPSPRSPMTAPSSSRVPARSSSPAARAGAGSHPAERREEGDDPRRRRCGGRA